MDGVPLPALLSTETGQDLQGPLAGSLIQLGIWRGRWRRRRKRVGWFGQVEANPTDVQILFEAVELKQVGEFQRPDVSASCTDLALEVANDSMQIVLLEAGMEEFVPKSFPVKAQAHALAGQTAIQRVSLLDTLDHGLLRLSPVNPGTCSMACCMV